MGLFSRIRNIVETDPLVIRDRIDNAAANSAKYPTQLKNNQPDTLAQQFERLNAPTQAAPGSVSPVIQTTSPTQAEQISAGSASYKPPIERDYYDRVKYGDKDMRSQLAERKLEIANELAGGDKTREELVDLLNQPGIGDGEDLRTIYSDDQEFVEILSDGLEGAFTRPQYESPDFIGEGQFGRVREYAPGYVVKEQAPLVEWGGYQDSQLDSTGARGSLFGKIYDYRDVAEDVAQMKTLSDMHIGPDVTSYEKLPDGSTKVVMPDLRENFTVGDKYMQANADAGDFLKNRLFNVKRLQQQGASANAGLVLGDRHEQNVMVNNMTGRPIQIDPSGTKVTGPQKDIEVANIAAMGFQTAGLDEEAEFYIDMFNEAMQKGDTDEMHYLAQSGLSRLQKIKSIPTNYSRTDQSESSISDALFGGDSIPF